MEPAGHIPIRRSGLQESSNRGEKRFAGKCLFPVVIVVSWCSVNLSVIWIDPRRVISVVSRKDVIRTYHEQIEKLNRERTNYLMG